MIEVSHLSKSFGRFSVVKDLSFRVEPGGVTGFLGPNGAGKSTTLRMIATLEKPTSGSIFISGFDVRRNRAEACRKIGFLPEHLPIYPELTVDEYLRFFAELRGCRPRGLTARVDFLLEACFLEDTKKKLCGHLSKGMKQRLGLAQALIHDPEVLLLDEPTSGLDPEQAVQIRRLLKSLAKTKTILLSSHLLHEVNSLCSRVLILRNGVLVREKLLVGGQDTESLEQAFLKAVGD